VSANEQAVEAYRLLARQLRVGAAQGEEEPAMCLFRAAGVASDLAPEAVWRHAQTLLADRPRQCPECEGAAPLFHLLDHLHRRHFWPLELVAHWLEQLE
jgi:hypothetical protein